MTHHVRGRRNLEAVDTAIGVAQRVDQWGERVGEAAGPDLKWARARASAGRQSRGSDAVDSARLTAGPEQTQFARIGL